jgi:EmrB/QacA subfamily drug resistance transporter
MTVIDNRSRNRLLGVLFLGVLMGALDIAIVGPALPAIQKALGIDARAVAWIFTIYVLFNLIGTALMAKLSDIFGRRSIYILDVTLFALGSLIVALSPGFGMLLAGRAVQGLGAGGIFPIAGAVIGDTFPPEKRGGALGMIGAVFGLAFLIGPILGGVLLYFASWPWLFIVNLPIAVVVIMMSTRLLPATRPTRRRSFDLPGMAMLAVLLASLVYGINRLDAAHFFASLTTLGVWPFLLFAIMLMPVFWLIERNAADPVLRLSLFRSRQIALAGALAGGAGLAEAAIVFVPQLLIAAFGVSASTASYMLLPIVLAMAVGAPLSGRIMDRVGSRVVIVAGAALASAGMLLVNAFAVNLALFYIAAALVGLGLSVLLGTAPRYIMLNEAPTSERASAQGILTLSSSIGQMIGGALVGAVAASYGAGMQGYAAAFMVVGVVLLLLALASLGLKGRAEELATVRRDETAPGAQPARS